MDNKEKKLLMTRVAKGEISMEDAELLIKGGKVAQNNPEQESDGKLGKDHAHKRKIKSKGRLK